MRPGRGRGGGLEARAPKGGSWLRQLLLPLVVCAMIVPIGYFFKEMNHHERERRQREGDAPPAALTPAGSRHHHFPSLFHHSVAEEELQEPLSTVSELDAELEAELAEELEIKRRYPPPGQAARQGGGSGGVSRGRGGGGGGGGKAPGETACVGGRPSEDEAAVFAHLREVPLPPGSLSAINLPLAEGEPGAAAGSKGVGKSASKAAGKGGKGGGAPTKRQPSCERYRPMDTSPRALAEALAASERFLPGAPACFPYRAAGAPGRPPFGGGPVDADGRPDASANDAWWGRGGPAAALAAPEVPCGFAGDSGFDLDTDMRAFVDCSVVVVTVIFGAQDLLHQPPESALGDRVCYVAFTDLLTLQAHMSAHMDVAAGAGRRRRGRRQVGLWEVVVVQNLPYRDPRRCARLPKTLSHRLFPTVRWSMWVDSKLQLVADPVLVLHQMLWREGGRVALAVSQHPVRLGIHEEVDALEKKGMFPAKGMGYAQLGHYVRRGGYPKQNLGVPDTSVLVRDHAHPALPALQCAWFNEIDRHSVRDQASFNYVIHRLGFQPTLGPKAFMQDPTGGAGKRDHAYKDTLTYSYESAELGGARIKIFAYCDHWAIAKEMGHHRRSGVASAKAVGRRRR